MINRVRIGLVQLEIKYSLTDISLRDDNMNRICEIISQMAVHKPDIIVLPDEFYAGSAYGQYSPVESIEKIEKDVLSRLKALAKQNELMIAGSLTAILSEDDLNAAHFGFIISKAGECSEFQEKLHLVKNENLFIKNGNEIKVFDTEIGKIGLLVGFDILFPEITRKMVLKGAEICIATVMAPGLGEGQKFYDKFDYPINMYKACAVARAAENQIFTVLANGVGKYPHLDLPIAGSSMVCSPIGPIFQADYNQDFSVVDIFKSHIEDSKKYLNLLEMRNEELCKIEGNEN